MQVIDTKIESWEKKLLDMGKRNRLLYFKETKRSNINILTPGIEDLYRVIVSEEKTLSFSYPVETDFIESNIFEENEEKRIPNIRVIEGDLTTNQTITEQQRTLKSLRNKAKTAIEEQGINVLYLGFGFLNWKESINSRESFVSPIILVPVTLTIQSLTSPYKIQVHDDEIVLNPTLKYKMENDFNITFPDFDSESDNIVEYLDKIKLLLTDYNWTIETKVSLALFSFLKINMYMDLHQRADILKNNFAIKALCGELDELPNIPEELNDYEHDKVDRPIDVFQTVDADSSQQDAIVLSKKGVSFVLQGPPGTGKSQTITNIISEALADGKKVLFVSEKMAALEVVYNRLSKVGLGDFCLTLHNHKANKKEILRHLSDTFDMDRIKLRDEVLYELEVLQKERQALNDYASELHEIVLPMEKSIYQVNGILAKLKDVPNIIFDFENIGDVSAKDFRNYEYLLERFSKTVGKLSEEYDDNVWKGSNVTQVTHELRQDIERKATIIITAIEKFNVDLKIVFDTLDLKNTVAYGDLENIRKLLIVCLNAHKVPKEWFEKGDMKSISDMVIELSTQQNNHNHCVEFVDKHFGESVYEVDVTGMDDKLTEILHTITSIIDNDLYDSEEQIYQNRDELIELCCERNHRMDEVLQNSCNITKGLKISKPVTLKDMGNYVDFLSALGEDLEVKPIWFKMGVEGLNQAITEIELCSKDLISEQEKFNLVKSTVDLELISAYLKIDSSNFDNQTFKIVADNATKLNSILSDFLKSIYLLKNHIGQVEQDFHVPVKYTIDYATKLMTLLECFQKQLFVTDMWFEIGGITKVSNFVNMLEKSQNKYELLLNKLSQQYSLDILRIDSKNMLERFQTQYTSWYKVFNTLYKNDIKQITALRKTFVKKIEIAEVVEILNLVNEIKDLQAILSEENIEARKYLGDMFLGENTSYEDVRINIDLFIRIKNYVHDDFTLEFKDLLLKNRNMSKYYETSEDINKIIISNGLIDFQKCIFNKNTESISFEELESYVQNIYSLLDSICKINQLNESFLGKSSMYIACFGNLYNGEKTDCIHIRNNIKMFQKISKYLDGNINTEIEQVLLNKKDVNLFKEASIFIEEKLDEEFVSDIKKLLGDNIFENAELYEIQNLLQNISINLSDMNCEIEFLIKNGRVEECLDYGVLRETVKNLLYIQQIRSDFTVQKDELMETFKFLFKGIETDWEEIRQSLTWMSEIAPYIEQYKLSDKFIEKILSFEYKDVISNFLITLNELFSEVDEEFQWFSSLYDEEYSLMKLPLTNSVNKLNRCILYLYGLEEWIDFKSARKSCYDNNLGDVVDVILNDKIEPQYVVSAFKKRFYKLWLDAVMPNYSSIINFRRKSQDEMIERFKEYDLKQMNIAKLRIKESLISKLPDVNKTTSSLDEVGILKRELAKQRKIMPIRKLFARIPNLLPALKPCLMMSPLSVSLFLESELYNFDLVIFDEASQVCTENAIGAIMRAKQIIVAGDNKQLPPTNFFSASTSDSDYDVEDEEEFEDGDYESILDEMLTVFPERSLKWHYRSKNEELITFSNVKIYNQSLITFPSSAEKIQDNGVEYVYVKDGIYDRGGKKNNINEAKKVAQMVFEHFKNRANRSIGVIAFSSSQQQAIDDEITKLRLANPMFEPFFNEDRDEPFFVKNLENVQGDERDTIIFSIGYAKDSKGVMYMNFGPLSRNGGYRRLNVAITRAKYNIKLVGSIKPTDIKSDVNAEGVKMLRAYIEFATNGKIALENELKYNKYVDVDSPFEEAVYDFLVSKGYKVITQVGCSGYRIDMAVKHPTLDGRFVIGIECDGATYHSSRTARERDRLRQSVLEDMGWKFHRIWSTDWIKDPVTEGELLISAVENAVANYVDDFEKVSIDNEELKDEIQEEYCETEVISTEGNIVEQFKFDTYVEADAFSGRQGELGVKGLCAAISHIIDVEYPIHYELLCKRIAPICGNHKATVKVRNDVNYGLNRMKGMFIRKGDFLYPNTYEDIIPKCVAEGEVPRNIIHISDDEIGAAMMMVVSDSFGVSKINLFHIVARAFGYNRTGANINMTFERVFNDLMISNRLDYIEDKVKIGEME